MHKYYLSLCLFVISILLITGCSKKTEQELWSQAQKNQREALIDSVSNNEKNAKLADAVSNYEKLVKDYPQSPDASRSLFEIAKIYHGKAIKNIAENESLKKGVMFYKRIVNEYPKSNEAPKALFMVGFIQANDLHNFDSATVAYKQFLEKYPDNEMASSAKSELDNMGLSPQDVIKKSLEAKK